VRLHGPDVNTQAAASTSADYFRLPPTPPDPPLEGVGWRMQLLLFLLGALIVISRRPDAITNPQFFAEDGTVWFADAFRMGFWRTLILPDAGYLQTFPRLVAGFAALVPLLYAPLLMNLVGIVVQVLPVNLLASPRLNTLGGLSFRMLLAFFYIAIPNSREIDVVITNAQWHLALIACLLVVAVPPRGWLGRAFDLTTLTLSGLTGPFCILLLPLNAVLWWRRRQAWLLVTGSVLAVCSALQIFVLAEVESAIRSKAPLGASWRLFVDILAGHVFLSSIFGSGNYSAHLGFALLCVVAAGGIAVIAFTIAEARWEFRIVLLFSLLVFAATLKSPLVSRTEPQWQILNQASGIRYWFFPMLAFLWSLLWCANRAPMKLVRAGSMTLLVISMAGIARDWKYPGFPDHKYPQYVAKFEALRPGQVLAFPIYPEGWVMQLTKPTPCREAPFGVIDTPSDGQHVSGTFTVRGWADAPALIQNVQVVLDQSQLAAARPTIPRPDVNARYPSSPNDVKGWETVVDTSRISPGRHVLTVRVRVQTGCESEIAKRSIEVSR
jgi:hypothetical protein